MRAYSLAMCSMVMLMVTVGAPVLAEEADKIPPRGYASQNTERNRIAAALASIAYPPDTGKHFEYKGLSDSAAVEKELQRRFGDRFQIVRARYDYRGFQALAVRDVREDTLFVVYVGSNDILDGLADVELFIETRERDRIPKTAWTRISSPMLDVQIDASLIFYKSAKQLYPSSKVVITGHSLGGALAQIVGATHKETVVTFASPGLPTSLLFRRRIEINQTFDMIDYTSSRDVVGIFGQDIGASIKVPPFFSGIRSHPLSEHGIDEYGRAVETAESGTLSPQVDRPELAPSPPARTVRDKEEENQRPGKDFHSFDHVLAGDETQRDDDGGATDAGDQKSNHPKNSPADVDTDQPSSAQKAEGSKQEASANGDNLRMIHRKTGKVLLDQGPIGVEEVKAEKGTKSNRADESDGTNPSERKDGSGSYTQDQWEEMQLSAYSKLVEARLQAVIDDIKPDTDPRQPDSVAENQEKADNVLAELGIKPDTDPWQDEFRDEGPSRTYIDIYVDRDPKPQDVEDEVNPPREQPFDIPPIDALKSTATEGIPAGAQPINPVAPGDRGGDPTDLTWVPRPSRDFDTTSDPYDDRISATSNCELSNVRDRELQVSGTIAVIEPNYSSLTPVPDLRIDDPKRIFDEDKHVQSRVLIAHNVPGLMSDVERYRWDDVGFLIIGGGYESDSVAEWAAREQPDRQIYVVNPDDTEQFSQIQNVVSIELDGEWLGKKVASRIESFVGKAEIYIPSYSSGPEIAAEKSSFARTLSGILDGMQGFAVGVKFASSDAGFSALFAGSGNSSNKLIVAGRGFEPGLRKLFESQSTMQEAYTLLIGHDEVLLFDRGLPAEPIIKIPTARDQVFQWAAKIAVEVARGAEITYRGEHRRCKISRRLPG